MITNTQENTLKSCCKRIACASLFARLVLCALSHFSSSHSYRVLLPLSKKNNTVITVITVWSLLLKKHSNLRVCTLNRHFFLPQVGGPRTGPVLVQIMSKIRNIEEMSVLTIATMLLSLRTILALGDAPYKYLARLQVCKQPQMPHVTKMIVLAIVWIFTR